MQNSTDWKSIKNRRLAALTALIFAAALAVCVPLRAADQVFQQTYPLSPGGSFALENINGSVFIDGWNRDEVEVQAVKTAKNDQYELAEVKIEVQRQPNQVAVHTLYPHGEGAEVAVEYHIHVPNRVLLGNVDTVNGGVLVRGVQGGGDLRSVNGDVKVVDSSGRFSARTTNGDVHLELRQLLDGAPMNLQTVNGSVVLGLPPDARANLNVRSVNGDFSSELPVSSAAGKAAHAFNVKLGMGGGEIFVRTINGGIRLLREPPVI